MELIPRTSAMNLSVIPTMDQETYIKIQEVKNVTVQFVTITVFDYKFKIASIGES